jgi:RHS repeat-associated protein
MAYREKAGGIFGFRKNSTANKLTVSALAFLFAVQPLYPAWAVEEGATITEPSVVSAESQVTTIELAELTVSPEAAVPTGEAESSESSAGTEGSVGSLAFEGEAPEYVPGMRLPTSQERIEPDMVSGALTYDYPIVVPPGRGGLQPDLHLSYNNQVQDPTSILGAGWGINIPYVERLNRKGTDKMYSDPFFSSSLDGELAALTGGGYGPKVEIGAFNSYGLADNVWTVTDKRGTTYKFGATAASRQGDPGDPSKTVRWMLQEVRDANDNFVRYDYYQEQGQVYPSAIYYTGHGSADGAFEVDFTRVSRPDVTTSYRLGFLVKTAYRIGQIQTRADGAWVRKYDLTYTAGDNGARSLLAAITESGQDEGNDVVSLPATSLAYQAVAHAWTQDVGWTWPSGLSSADSVSGLKIVDLNGDGMDDVMGSYLDSSHVSHRAAYLNDGNKGWIEDSGYTPPVDFAAHNPYLIYEDTAFQVIDLNGDGLVDIVSTASAYLNSGTGWTPSVNYVSPLALGHLGGGVEGYARLADLNGDGLPDLFEDDWNATAVYLNNGDGWTEDTSWTSPLSVPYGLVVTDVNGDGLADLVQAYRNRGQGHDYRQTYINSGDHAFVEDVSYAAPVNFVDVTYNSGLIPAPVRLLDLNGDGLLDLLYGKPNAGTAYLNSGAGWSVASGWVPPPCDPMIGPPDAYSTCQSSNLSGDALPSLMLVAWDNNSHSLLDTVWSVAPNRPDLLAGVLVPTGGSIAVTYTAAAQYRNAQGDISNPKLSLNLDTVSRLTHNAGPGMGSSYSDDFVYEGGKYYFGGPFDRKFAGFGKITQTAADGTITKTYFHQGDGTDSDLGEYDDHIAKAGKPYRVEVMDGAGNPYATTVSKWDRADLGGGRSFVKLVQKVEMAQDGDATHKDKAETYAYDDATGNLTVKTEWGEVTASGDGTFTDVGTDNFTTSVSYAASVGSDVTGLPSQETVTDHSAAKVSEARHYYDALALGSVDKGNETKAERWVSGTSYVDTEKTYDAYGLVTEEKDALDHATGYAYDAYHLYPATFTNALDHETAYLYDYSAGKPKQVTDPNGRVFQTVFDGLDRVTAERQPDAANPAVLVDRTTYAYTSLAVGDKVRRTDWLDGSTGADSLTYTDGLGRVIQERRPAGIANAQAVTDTVYNNRGLVAKKSLPYFSSVQPHSIHCERAPSGITATVTGPLLDGTALIATPPNPVSLALGATGYGWPSQVTAPWRADSVTHEIAIPADVSSFNLYLNDAAVTGDFWLKLPPNAGAPWTASGACAMGAYEISVLPGATPVVPTSDASLYTVFSYDPLQRVIAAADAVGTTTTAYDGWKTTVTDVSGHAKDYFRDAYGRLVRVDEHDGAATHATAYAYDYLGDLTGLTDALGNVRALTYDGLGRRLTAEDLHAPADQTFGSWSYAYDAAGNLVQRTDARGQVVDWTYDEINRPLTEDWAGGAGVEVTNTYDSGTDGLGRLTGVATADVTKSLAYNALGQLTSETSTIDSTGYTTTHAYDRQGHETLTTSPDGSQVKNDYNAAGLVEAVQRKESGDANWSDVVVNYDYAPTGQPTVVEYANGAVTTNTYDAAHLYRLARRLTTGLQYAPPPTVVSFYPTAGDGHVYNQRSTWGLAHDGTTGSGSSHTGSTMEVKSGKYSSSYVISRSFLPFDTSSLPDDAVVTDAKLKVYVAAKENGDNDGEDFVTVIQSSQPSVTSLAAADFDLAGGVTNPAEGVDEAGRKDIGDVPANAYLAFSLNEAGRSWVSLTGPTKLGLREGHDVLNQAYVSGTTSYNKLTVRSREYAGTTYDPVLEVTYTSSPPVAATSDLNYTYDPAGNVTQIVDASSNLPTARTVDYAYDDLDRLLSATATGVASGQSPYTQTWTYDAIGNILTGPAGSYTYAGDQGTSYANPHAATQVGSDALTYDPNGNLLTKGTTAAYSWDYANRLATSVVNTTASAYAYDASGQRVKLLEDGVTTIFPSGGYEITAGTPTKQIEANGATVATVVGTGASAVPRYVHTDHLTGSNVVTSSTGTVDELMDYYPYGGIRIDQKAGTYGVREKYAGHDFDQATGLSYMGARYYDAAIGRFLSQDPAFLAVGDRGALSAAVKISQEAYLANPQHLNSYSYAFNNPMMYRDPDGNFAFLAPLAVLYAPQIIVGAGMAASLIGASIASWQWGSGVGYMMEGNNASANASFDASIGTSVASGTLGAGLIMQGMETISSSAKTGPYADMKDSGSVKAGGKFTPTQKANIYKSNMDRNGGMLRSDMDGQELVIPSKSMPGVTPPKNEAQIDHIAPRNPANSSTAPGTNSYGNAQVLSREQNKTKSNR